jgi:hypothetical protein
MPQETEHMIRKSLNAVDQHRRRLMWVLVIAGVVVAWEFYRLAEIRPTGDVPGMILQAVMALFFCILGVAVLMVFQLTVATKRILRAIALASKPAE